MRACGRKAAAGLLMALVLSAQGPPAETLRHAVGLHQTGDVEGAIREYRAYLKQDPANVMARSNLGAALAQAGRYEEAVSEYEKALEREPANAPVRMNLALAYYKSARMEKAAKHLEAVLKQQPSNRQALLLLADCELNLGANRRVIDLLSPAEKQTPDDRAVIYMLGSALIRDSQAARGQLLVDRILRDGDSAEARLMLGTAKMNAQDFSGALPDLQKAVELNPLLPDVYSYFGLALLATGDMAGAADAFRQELKSDPNDFAANLQLGVIEKQNQEYDAARRRFDRALLARPGDPGVRYQLATLDLAAGKTEEARRALEQLTRETPQFVEAHVSLATAYYRLGRKEDGDRERTEVLKLNAEKQAREPASARP